VPITSITNGVHARTWTSPEVQAIFDRIIGSRLARGTGRALGRGLVARRRRDPRSPATGPVSASSTTCASGSRPGPGPRRRGARPRRAHHRFRPAVRHLQAGHPAAVGPSPPRASARRRRAPRAVRVRRQGPSRRRAGQGPAAPGARRLARPGPGRSVRVPRRLRHRCGPGALPRQRRLAEQPGAAPGGVWHLGREGGAQRCAQLLGPRRLVGRDVRRRQRLGHPVVRGVPRPLAARCRRGRGALRRARARDRPAVLRRRQVPMSPRWLDRVRHTWASLGPQVGASRMVRDYNDLLYRAAAPASPTGWGPPADHR
jgi:hypothetical protein